MDTIKLLARNGQAVRNALELGEIDRLDIATVCVSMDETPALDGWHTKIQDVPSVIDTITGQRNYILPSGSGAFQTRSP